MVTEDDPAICGREIASIIQTHRRCGARGIESEDPAGDESAVEPVRHRVRAKRRNEQPRRIHRLAARECQPREARRTKCGDQRPDENRGEDRGIAFRWLGATA